MWVLRVVVRVPDAKRKEFANALEKLPLADPSHPDVAEMYEGVEDRTRVCWHAYWSSEANARAFLRSNAYRAVRGAARVAGELEAIEFGSGESIT